MLSVRDPLILVVPVTVMLKPAKFNDLVVFTVSEFKLTVLISSVIAVLMITSSPAMGTPAGLQLPAVFHVAPVEVFVTPNA